MYSDDSDKIRLRRCIEFYQNQPNFIEDTRQTFRLAVYCTAAAAIL